MRSLVDELQIETLGVLHLKDAFGEANLGIMQEVAAELGIEIEGAAVDLAQVDFASEIAQLRGTDALYLPVYPSHLISFLAQSEQAGYRGDLIGAYTVAFPQIFAIPAVEGMYMTSPLVYNPNFLFAQEVAAVFESAYDKPFSSAQAVMYEPLFMIADLMEDERVTRDNLREILDQGFSYSGVFGEMNAPPGDHELSFPLYPSQVVGGKLEYLE